MTTRRERKQARADQLREWAQKRETAAGAVLADPRRHDHAFNTQPGHIPERARVIAREDRAFESLAKAGKMEQRADGIERQMKRTIYSDDEDAIERIDAKIATLERRRERMKAVNAAYKKGDEAALEALGVTLNEVKAKMAVTPWHRHPYPAYALTNTGAEIRRLKQRREDISKAAARDAEAEAAGGIIVKDAGACSYADWRLVTVRFSEKPEREIIRELKDAAFWWGGGQWTGYLHKLPERYQNMIQREETT